MSIEPQCLIDKRADLIKKKKHAGANLPALARRDYDFMKNIKTYPGHIMCSFDFVSLEPSVTAAWSNDVHYKYATCDGIGKKPFTASDGTLMVDDLYLMFATQLRSEFRDKILETFDKYNFWDQWLDPNVDRESLSKHKDIKGIRNFAKTAALGIERGMGKGLLQENILAQGFKDVTKQECQDVIDKFWEFFPGVTNLKDRLYMEVKKRGYFYTRPFGFKVNCEPSKAYAHFSQAQASGIMDVMMYKLFNVCDYAKFHALIHDEVVTSVPEDKLDEYKATVLSCLDSLNSDLNWSVPMRVGFAQGLTFGDCK